MWKINNYINQIVSEGRKIYIWGTGRACKNFIFSFRGKDVPITAVIDDLTVSKEEIYLKKYAIITSDEFMNKKDNAYVIVTTEEEMISKKLKLNGFREDLDYIVFSKLIVWGFTEKISDKQINKPLINQMDVKITYACNFKCEYCYQADENGNHQSKFLSKENAERLIEFVRKLDDIFYITLAGGEPFVYPYLQYLVEELTSLGNYISIITNFSAAYEKIKALILTAKDKLAVFNISVHLSQWKDIREFYAKLRQVLNLLEKENIQLSIRATCVITEQNFERVKKLDRAMNEKFPEVSFEIQREYHNSVYVIYSEEIEQFLKQRGLDVPVESANKIDFYGQKCWAGSKFFYIEADGEVRRCYTNQFNKNSYKLGNLLNIEEIKVYSEAMPCLSVHGGDCICHPNFSALKIVSEQLASKEELGKFYNNF